jgi:hypothetical protein
MSPVPSFELLRFEATPVGPAVAVVELDGRFAGRPEPARPRLLVELDGVAREFPALWVGASPWSATFAVPLGDLESAAFSLVPGRGPLIGLPAPTFADGGDDRFVRLARTANDLRHRLGEATEHAASAASRFGEVSDERARLETELAAAQERAREAHESALAAREAQAGAEGAAEDAREALTRARDEARAEVAAELARLEGEAAAAREELEAVRASLGEQLAEAQERAIAAEDDARAARIDLRDVRARVEALTREQRTTRIAAARAEVPTATPGDSTEFRAARLGPEWADGPPRPEDASGDPGEAPFADPTSAPFADGAPTAEDPTAEPFADEAAGERLDEEAPAPSARASPDSSPSPDPTLPLRPAADAAPTTAQLASVDTSPELWSDDTDDSVRILRPRTPAGRMRPPRVLQTDELEDGPLEPGAVGASVIQAGEGGSRHRAVALVTSPRVIVGGIFLLLIVALVLIFRGVGPV